MVATYTILGRQVGSHVLAMATLGTLFGGAYFAMSGGSKKPATPPINASSTEEESFIKEFIKQAEAESDEKKTKH